MDGEELKNAEPAGEAGFPDTEPAGGQTIGDGPQNLDSGQSVETQSTSEGAPTEDTFFNPADIADKPELMSAYKGMQSAYTKKMQSIAEQRNKIEAYDAFYQNPMEQVQRIAQQYGMKLTPADGAQSRVENQGHQGQVGEDWQPQNWNDVLIRAKDMAKQEIMQDLNPVFSQVQNMRKQSIEQSLTEIDPTWHQYEDQMKSNLQTHPTLANDPAMLYRLSVPQEVLESRATQAAIKKMEDRQKSAGVSGTSTTSKKPGSGLPDKPLSFPEAVEAAKKKLAEQGIRPG